MSDTPTDEEILALCDAATREIERDDAYGNRYVINVWDFDDENAHYIDISHDEKAQVEFIRACSPETVRSLVVRAQTAEAKVVSLETFVREGTLPGLVRELRARADAAEAQLAALVAGVKGLADDLDSCCSDCMEHAVHVRALLPEEPA